jgi:NTP pyrophosphatase (non-canonical NTP hydrolase)
MEDEMKRLLELVKRNADTCPWTKEQTSEKFIRKLAGEMDEFKEAYGKQDWDNVEEELGDLFWDVLTLAYILERENKLKASKVVSRIHGKISHRKPWLITGETVSIEDAKKIWMERKEKEKQAKR